MIIYKHARQLDALGDPTRRAILERLLDGPQPVGELARGFTVTLNLYRRGINDLVGPAQLILS